MKKFLKVWVDLFPVWVLFFSFLAWFRPDAFGLLAPFIVPGIGIIMFGMGMTLSPRDFARVMKKPRAVLCGVVGQFLIMPALALLLARLFQLSPELTMGFIILGSCPGGAASNVITYLARADVALSVTMTACTTLLAVGMTPLLVWYLGGAYLPVKPGAMLLSVAGMVLGPVLAGLFIHVRYQRRVEKLMAVFPALSVFIIVLVIAAIIGKTHDQLLGILGVVGVAVVLHNVLGMMLGHGLAKLCYLPRAACRTISIEVGMQNSGLGVALATLHFNAIAALPASLFSVVHNLTGSIVAAYWRRDAR
ncbi:MAG: bile acid:sodium symporter family protein [Candidatus Hydrogenedentes bacterium]|nr:bile acid:sodium symporter family protein [Candidatus Hydrogenedentota bacterium]